MRGSNITKEKSKGRKEQRKLEIYANLKGVDPKWKGIKSILKITRKVKSKKKL